MATRSPTCGALGGGTSPFGLGKGNAPAPPPAPAPPARGRVTFQPGTEHRAHFSS